MSNFTMAVSLLEMMAIVAANMKLMIISRMELKNFANIATIGLRPKNVMRLMHEQTPRWFTSPRMNVSV